MPPISHHLACDLGAESGRVILGTLDADRLRLREIHRFATGGVKRLGSLVWDMPRFLKELESGLTAAASATSAQTLRSFSTDSWGLDYLLYDDANRIIEPAFHYRDRRTRRGLERVLSVVSRETLFAETGLQLLPINTLFQLAAEDPDRMSQARRLLLVGDAFNHHACGVGCAEVSLASTTQLYNPHSRSWSTALIDALNLPKNLLPNLVNSGTPLGPIAPDVARRTGLHGVEVIAGCSHDTAAAVVAVPSRGDSWAYISSGTWSLMGVERAEPVLTQACCRLNFTNEIGYGNTVRLLKNLIGLWLVQECRRVWEGAGKTMDYAGLTALASEAVPFRSLIHPADPRFVAPANMVGEIASYCRESGQAEPDSPGAIVRCALESLALLYRQTLGELEQITGQPLRHVHIVGGGSQNRLLNQFAANACRVTVWAGPVEATAAGNVLAQALALGLVASPESARELVRQSFEVERFEPCDTEAWESAYGRFRELAIHQAP